MISVADIAQRYHIPKRTVLHAVMTGKLPATRIGPAQGMYLVAEDDLETWLAARESA